METRQEVGRRPIGETRFYQRAGWKGHESRGKREPGLSSDEGRIEDFLATLAHELRSPLAAMHMAMELFEARLPNDPKLHALRRLTQRQLRHLTRLVDDLGDTSSIMAGKVVLEREWLDLREIVSHGLELVQPLRAEYRHLLVSEIPDRPIHLQGDRTRLTQLVSNLLTNAAKFTPHEGRIELRLETRDDEARIVVRDNGIGIEPAMLPRLFDRLVQADAPGDGSMGLGLPLVRRIAELHHGTVSAHSDGIGCGSEFTVCLPLYESGMPAVGPTVPMSGLS